LRAQKKAKIKPGQSVLVIGSGMSGILHIALAKALGAGRIMATDIEKFRLQMAEQYGAEHTFLATDDLPAQIKRHNNGLLADVVLVCAGAVPAIRQALQCVERGGTILLFAPTGPQETIPLSINDVFWGTDVTLTTSYAGSPADHMEALELIRSGRINVKDMITHCLPLAQAEEGFRLVTEAKESMKVILKPQE